MFLADDRWGMVMIVKELFDVDIDVDVDVDVDNDFIREYAAHAWAIHVVFPLAVQADVPIGLKLELLR